MGGVEQVEDLLRFPVLHGEHGATRESGTKELRDDRFGQGLTTWRARNTAHD